MKIQGLEWTQMQTLGPERAKYKTLKLEWTHYRILRLELIRDWTLGLN